MEPFERHMATPMTCAAIDCEKSASFDKPLCYIHWRAWDSWELEECIRCHWFVQPLDFVGSFRPPELTLEYPDFCAQCTYLTLVQVGKVPVNPSHPPEDRSILSHASMRRDVRYVYILKLSDGTFYIGQTNDMVSRLEEHQDGDQPQTQGKDPRLVYYEPYEGERDSVNEREGKLIHLNQDGAGRRRLRQMIQRFRAPLRLLDLEA